jgi:hypothetical protein
MFANISKQLEDVFFNLPPIRAYLEEAKQKVECVRQDHIDAIEALTIEVDALYPKLDAQVRAAREKYTAAEKALMRERTELERVLASVHTAKVTKDAQIDRHRAALRDTAPEEIDLFRAEMRREFERLRNPVPAVDRVTSGYNRAGQPVELVVTNWGRIKARVNRLHEITSNDEYERLKSLPSSEVPAAIQALRDSLPSTDGWDDPALAQKIQAAQVENAEFRKLANSTN